MRKEFAICPLSSEHVEEMWRINEEGVPGVGQVSSLELGALLQLCSLSLGAFEGDRLVGFVLCLLPGTPYKSLNYGWFNERFQSFLYVDRIAVSKENRNDGIGTLLYRSVLQSAQGTDCPVAAEVNLSPPNPGSMRFHLRNGFKEIGTLEHPTYTVAMLMTESLSLG